MRRHFKNLIKSPALQSPGTQNKKFMKGSYIDSTIAAIRGKKHQKKLQSEYMSLLSTQAGILRVLDTKNYHKQPLVMVPDGPCVIEHYVDLIDLLYPDFRVICFELPGFGFSYPAFDFDFSISHTSNLLVEILNLLNIRVAILAFTCANGFFAMHLAKYHPERVSHLVLGQTPSFQSMLQWKEQVIPKIIDMPYIGQLIVSSFARKFSSNWYNLALPKNSKLKSQFITYADIALKSGGCFCLASYVQGLNRSRHIELMNISTPTLLIYGNSDPSHKYTNFLSIQEHIPTAEIVVFDECGHFPDLEYSRKYVKSIKRFIRKK